MELLKAIHDSDFAKASKLIEKTSLKEKLPNGESIIVQAIHQVPIEKHFVYDLIRKGADPNLKDAVYKEYPLHAIIKLYPHGSDASPVLENLLTHGANPELTNDEGDTALHVAAKSGCAFACAKLIEAGANPNARNKNKKTPIDLAQDVLTQTALKQAIANTNS